MTAGARDAGAGEPVARGRSTSEVGVAGGIPELTVVHGERWGGDDAEQRWPQLQALLDGPPVSDGHRDEFDWLLQPRPQPARARRRVGRLIAAVCGVLACAVAVVVAVAVGRHPATPQARRPAASPTSVRTPAQTAQAQQPAAAPAPPCVAEAGAVASGTGVGGTDSGPDAILWFEHSYYVERSAARARQVVAPKANVAPVPALQAGIDRLPPGTGYCVTVKPGPPPPPARARKPAGLRQWLVVVGEQRPGQPVFTADQTVSTMASRNGRVLITNIIAAR